MAMADEASFWEVASAVGQVVAAVAAVGGLFFLAIQIRAARRVSDIQILQEFSKEAICRESELLAACTQERKDQAFVEYLNFLEIYAGALNGGLVPATSRKLISDNVANAIATIQSSSIWSQKLAESIRTPSTYDEIGSFIRKNKREIENRTTLFRSQQHPTSDQCSVS
jgi:hypothetical protein